jgi:hypothetical protein
MTKILRSLLIGHVNRYPSEFAFGVNQAMTLMGHWHSNIDIRSSIDQIRWKIEQMQPHIIWGHMILWPPPGAPSAVDIFKLLCDWKIKGTKVVMHQGDVKRRNRFPYDISKAVDLALCNNFHEYPEWNIKSLYWPYFAFVQKELAKPANEFKCDLFFAGTLGRLTDNIYGERTKIVRELENRLGPKFRIYPTRDIKHTLYRTPEVAVSANAILGYGRPESSGWVDVRTFQYPGAGGVLLTNDTGGFLDPWIHYIPYQPDSIDSILEGIKYAKKNGAEIRKEAFKFLQENHTCLNRVKQVLEEVGL